MCAETCSGCEWVSAKIADICCCQLNFLFYFLFTFSFFPLASCIFTLHLVFFFWCSVRSFQHYTLVSGATGVRSKLHNGIWFHFSGTTILGMDSIASSRVQLQPGCVGHSETVPQKSKTTRIKTRKNLLHLKMLPTFQDWPAAGTVTTDGKAESKIDARKMYIYGSEYFIQAFSFVACALLFSLGIFSGASSFIYYCISWVLCLHTFTYVVAVWHKGRLNKPWVFVCVCVPLRGMHMQTRGNDIYAKGMICVRCCSHCNMRNLIILHAHTMPSRAPGYIRSTNRFFK